MKVSNELLGTAFGGTMLALLATGSAEAADAKCEDIDLTRADSIAETYGQCLADEEIVLLEAGDENIEMTEVENRGCEQEKDRGLNQMFWICTVAAPPRCRGPGRFRSQIPRGQCLRPGTDTGWPHRRHDEIRI